MPQKTGYWKEPNYKARIHSGSGASAEHRSSLETEDEIKVEIKVKGKIEIKVKDDGDMFNGWMCDGGGLFCLQAAMPADAPSCCPQNK